MTLQHLDLAMTPSMYQALTKLDFSSQRDVNRTLSQIDKDLPSLHLHKLQGVPFVSFGISSGALRVICKREGNLLILLHVDQHDAAYAWARRHKVVQIGRYVRLLPQADPDAADAPPTLPENAWDAPQGPLAAIPLKHFRRFHIEEAAAAFLRTVPNEQTLVELLVCFKDPQAEALMGLATDPEDLQRLELAFHDALRALEDAAQPPPPPPPLAQALQDRANAAEFFIPGNDALLQSLLKPDFDLWRVFLHPTQRRLVEADFKGAAKVTGGPGTGKTVLALHRVRYLVERTFPDDPRPVLLTVFSRVLAAELQRNLALLCEDRPDLLQRVHVRTLTRAAQDVLDSLHRPSAFLDAAAVDAAWEDALHLDALGFGRAFYEAERDQVVARLGAWTEPAYLTAPREARDKRLDRLKKRQVWRVLAAFEDALRRAGGGDTHALARDATDLLTTGAVASPYAAVVCDEVQDTSAADLRLLAALTRDPATGLTRPNALLLVGDPYQSLYRRPVALARCGVEVRGRAHILKRNYRTTEGIRRAAIQAVLGVTFDPEEDDAQSASTFDGYTSLRPGPPPTTHAFPTPEAEADWIALQARDPAPGPLLVLTRTQSWRDALADRLRTRGLTPRVLESRDLMSNDDGLVLCTLHRSKGLEAPRVLIAGAHQLPQPWPGAHAKVDKSVWERQEKCLLYVGMTRARDWCAVSSVTAPNT